MLGTCSTHSLPKAEARWRRSGRLSARHSAERWQRSHEDLSESYRNGNVMQPGGAPSAAYQKGPLAIRKPGLASEANGHKAWPLLARGIWRLVIYSIS